MKLPDLYFTINVSHLYCQTFSLKVTKFLKSVQDYQALPIILPYTFLFTKQSDFKKASSNKVLKYGTKFQSALTPNNPSKALKYHVKIIY